MKKIFVSFLIATSLIPLISFSSNLPVREDLPISYFTDQDFSIFQTTQMKTLNNTRDGRKVVWKNSATGANGYFIPANTSRQNGLLCRDLTIFNSAQNRTGLSKFRFCKINNMWKITG